MKVSFSTSTLCFSMKSSLYRDELKDLCLKYPKSFNNNLIHSVVRIAQVVSAAMVRAASDPSEHLVSRT